MLQIRSWGIHMVLFIAKHRTQDLCNPKCHKIGKYGVPFSQILNWGIENQNIQCSLLENIGHRFPNSEMSKIGTPTCSYLNTKDFWICCKIRNRKIACSLLENIRHRFLNSEMSKIGNRNMDMFVFEHIGFLYMLQNRKSGHNMYVIFTRKISGIQNVGYWKTYDIGFLQSKISMIVKVI